MRFEESIDFIKRFAPFDHIAYAAFESITFVVVLE